MNTDDPRHGTARGYVIGCREECCRRAQMVYMKRYRMGQTPSFTDPTGTHRRIQALQALGHSSRAIAEAVGHQEEWARSALVSPRITTTTAAKVARAYEMLSMIAPQGHVADRVRSIAAAKGWYPPLAWDDIDDREERPRIGSVRPTKRDVDPVVVARILGGESLPATAAEKREVVRLWDRSLNELARLTGWKTERYIDRKAS